MQIELIFPGIPNPDANSTQSSSWSLRALALTALLPFLLILGSSCSVQQHIPEGRAVLANTEVKNAPDSHQYKLTTLVKQQPNNRFLSTIRLGMWTYLLAGGEVPPRDSIPEGQWFVGKAWQGLKETIRRDAGQPPVILDSAQIRASAAQMETYLADQGHLSARVASSVDVTNQQATVTYDVQSEEPYQIGNVDYFIQDRALNRLITEEREQKRLDSGRTYSSQKLRKERNRISRFLQNRGFYNFSKRFIEFQVDTSVGEHTVNVAVMVANPADYQRHRQYEIGQVYINPSFQMPDTAAKDTLTRGDYYFISDRNKLIIEPEALLSKIPIEPGTLYQSDQKRRTYNRLSQLAIYKFVDVRFFNTRPTGDNKGKVDCYIQLTPDKQHILTRELEATLTDQNDQFAASVVNNSRYYGIAPSVNYRNKNLLRKGISWDLNLRGAYEFSNQWFENQANQNIFEFGANTSLQYYGSFLPSTVTEEPLANTVRTSLNLSYLLEGNVNYQRNTSSFSYTWRFNNELSTVYASPVSVNLVNTTISRDTFRRQIDEFDNPFVQSIFDTYTITGGELTWVYDDEPLLGDQHWLIRWNFEPAGNLLYLLSDQVIPFFQQQVFNAAPQEPQSDGTFEYGFGDIGFYTFTKTRADFRYYIPGNGENELVLRLAPGIGLGYGNNDFMPFEERFFVGGSNSVRAWAVRDLGPGAYSDNLGDASQSLDLRVFQVGDVKIEGNIEYRFDLFYRFKGALFADFGNVWLLTEPGGTASDQFEEQFFREGRFESDFYEEIAIGTGFGLRMDWTFFILRLDFGWPVRTPKAPRGRRWISYDRNLGWFAQEARLNIGVGYPF